MAGAACMTCPHAAVPHRHRLPGRRRCAGLGCQRGMVWRDMLHRRTCLHACAPAAAPSLIRGCDLQRENKCSCQQ